MRGFAFLRPVKSRKQYLEEQDKAYLELALAQSDGNVPEAAALIGVSRPYFYRLMERYRIPLANPEWSAATRLGKTEHARTAAAEAAARKAAARAEREAAKASRKAAAELAAREKAAARAARAARAVTSKRGWPHDIQPSKLLTRLVRPRL